MSSSSPGMNFWMVAKMMPPEGRLPSLARRSGRVSAWVGCSRNRSWARLNTPKSCPSKSLRSVMTTMVGFSIAASRITRAAKQVMVMLLPLPWVCHTTPPLWLPPGRDAATTWVIAADLLDQAAIVFKQHEKAQVIEQHVRGQNAAHHGLQLAKLAIGVEVD